MRRLRAPASAGIFQHRLGNALVLHVDDRISVAARSLALAVAADPDHDVVVLDLHHDLPVGTWGAVATALKRCRRGIRLVVCGVSADTGALAAQWLCDRLRRPVVTPHGRAVQVAAGTLFAHTAEGSGWVRYLPGRRPAWESQRYPAPPWDAAAARFQPTSAVGAAEPVPGGVWIRDTRDPVAVGGHWQWLVASLPCQPEAMTVVLGCPGTPPLALDDVARFWRELDPAGRRHARFVQYGPVQLPAGEVLGQRLADLLESPVVCFGGLPLGRPGDLHMHTVTPDGSLGWQVLARELCYTPRPSPAAPARPPRIVGHHAPALLGAPVGPLTYRYATDAVVEIVPSGLWIRADEPPGIAGRIRSRAADPTRHALIVDDTTPSRVARFRELAEDLTARLDPATRARSTLQLASAVATGPRAPATGSAGGDLGAGLTYRFTAADLASGESTEATPTPAEALAVTSVPGPQSASWVPTVSGDRAGTGVPTPTAAEFLTSPVAAPEPPAAGPAPVVTAALLAPPGGPTVAGAVTPLRDRPGTGVPPTGAPAAAGTCRCDAARRPVRFQPTPTPDAPGLSAPTGLDSARSWLRWRHRREFDAATPAISRLLAEHPGLYPDDDSLADAVAVRLYLSAPGEAVDRALRAGPAGDVTHFARCVAAGVARLPAHRGAVCLSATLPGDDLRDVAARETLTERGFTHALTEPPVNVPGNVDVLLWSMTARRTRLLEPEGEHRAAGRVLFLPGTRFRVLATTPPDRHQPGRLLLRELTAEEPCHGRVPFDEFALTSLSRCRDRWAATGRRGRVGDATAQRLTCLPGVA
ncbi:hypothetical protein [Micromonospora antibiotica]|uniref:Uncharacterized protein n=1 Tax=Micromonospora antibiotica TaxID=2807623 RepID=A0ABS3V8N1_9ACTN|nr:hypothetical protein [Micromonospora antibiotica]MBO4161979.1 hypothetical protein [Micromonospora antibiotica]